MKQGKPVSFEGIEPEAQKLYWIRICPNCKKPELLSINPTLYMLTEADYQCSKCGHNYNAIDAELIDTYNAEYWSKKNNWTGGFADVEKQQKEFHKLVEATRREIKHSKKERSMIHSLPSQCLGPNKTAPANRLHGQ